MLKRLGRKSKCKDGTGVFFCLAAYDRGLSYAALYRGVGTVDIRYHIIRDGIVDFRGDVKKKIIFAGAALIE